MTEIVRGIPWGFHEWNNRRLFTIDTLIRNPDIVRGNSTGKTNIYFFNILTGEGVSRNKFEEGVRNSVKNGADEIWAMEHNIYGSSWKNKNQWPRGRLVNFPRESNSTMFDLESMKKV